MIGFYLAVRLVSRTHHAAAEVSFRVTEQGDGCPFHLLFRDTFVRRERDFHFSHTVVETEVDGLAITSYGTGIQDIESGVPATLVGNIRFRFYVRGPCTDAGFIGVLPIEGIIGILRACIARCVHHVCFVTKHAFQ